MNTTKGTKAEARLAEDTGATDTNVPRRMTPAENVILTIKLLAGFGLFGIVLWVINVWTSVK